jgi:hypothetical protein
MDQEADDYDVLAALHDAQLRYVIRADPARQTTDAKQTVTDVLAHRQSATVFRRVRVTPRSQRTAERTRGRHPARDEREAALRIRWGAVTLPRRQYTESRTPTLTMWAVHVWEPKPPRDEAPIAWMLFTSEPVETLEDATAVVDHYRARWVAGSSCVGARKACGGTVKPAAPVRQAKCLPAPSGIRRPKAPRSADRSPQTRRVDAPSRGAAGAAPAPPRSLPTRGPWLENDHLRCRMGMSPSIPHSRSMYVV